MSMLKLTRREILGAAAGSAVLAATRTAHAAEGITIGMIYVGSKDDFGWNQSHAAGAKALKALPGVTVLEEENVAESDAVLKTMDSMINIDGAKLLFPTSFGYFDPFMIEEAKKYPAVEFRHPTSLWDKSKHPKNLGGYFCFLDQAHYVNGVAAGLSTTSNKIGFVAAKPIPLVLRNINAFMLGVRQGNPKATVHLVVTGEWSLPVREAEATNALIDAGCDVITCHVDSPKVCVQTAESRGVKTCGHNADLSQLAPKGFITGAELKWATVYTEYAGLIAKGEKLPNVNEGGYDKDMVQSSPFGAGATEKAKDAATKAIAAVKKGTPIFVGPLKDNKGNQVVAGPLGLYDPTLWGMNYLLEGVVGSIV
ncbi:BMP family ABC transporter substrate-binding protein [Lichenifustis flavocetrariae]|uniref:BMP family ABC transporter substrate-binding protein n=1 Tax=Lichenifustis flavocetrariae TaxID=2949735 RepID=A0AA42CJD1_9HYPH|nr:BMP family ABC transporter substrate-binding protein [Lichenifustis flavocetrariae]MCW6507936.1 BMP family ABC transporter substrate-binding protein [Lichenifustis flavocetrariae]